jgi:hypothetical protein
MALVRGGGILIHDDERKMKKMHGRCVKRSKKNVRYNKQEFVIESYPAADDQQTASQGVESHDCLFHPRNKNNKHKKNIGTIKIMLDDTPAQTRSFYSLQKLLGNAG